MMQEYDNEKDNSRIASILGTWTGESEMKASVGRYGLKAYFVVHFMADPMRGHGCSWGQQEQVDDETNTFTCNEIDNNACVVKHVNESWVEKECVSMENHTLVWSDVSAFLYLGATVDVGFPANLHVQRNTSGWIGPYSLILAQNRTYQEQQKLKNNTSFVDRYSSRYVRTLSTPYLYKPIGSSFSNKEFDLYLGQKAISETTRLQTKFQAADLDDPYAQYLDTCENGDVQPVLPLFDFSFTKDHTGMERLDIQLDYRVMAMPKKGTAEYRLMPTIQKRFSNRIPINGPYCFEGDPKRAYTFDVTSRSGRPDQRVTLLRGCVQGLPCEPPEAFLAYRSGYNASSYPTANNIPLSSAINLDLLLMTALSYVLGLLCLISMTCNLVQYRRHKHAAARVAHESDSLVPNPTDNLQEREQHDRNESLVPNIPNCVDAGDRARGSGAGTETGEHGEHKHCDPLQQPLLDKDRTSAGKTGE